VDFDFRFLSGLAAGLFVVLVAWRARSLSASGAIAASAIGTAAAFAGRNWVALLLFYFVSSSVLSRIGRAQKLERTTGMIEKHGARDGRQVLSNGLVFGAAALANVFLASREIAPLIAAGALAASAADTWATEVGTLLGGAPRSILTGRKLVVGTSGGVTVAGLAASAAGAAFVSFVAAVSGLTAAFWTVTVAGIAGSLFDSITGALLQRRQWCDACGTETEMRVHTCGTATRQVRGVSLVDNDVVNFLATVMGAGVALGIPWAWSLTR
jgi:uncharacterized protein (TIGR00297 family)